MEYLRRPDRDSRPFRPGPKHEGIPGGFNIRGAGRGHQNVGQRGIEALDDYRERTDMIAEDSRLGIFNRSLPQASAHLRMSHDTEFILPEVLTTYAPPPFGNEFHGHYSQATTGNTVPGFPDPKKRSVGISAASDLKGDNLNRTVQETKMPAPHNAMLGDKGQDPNIMKAMQSLLGTGQQTPQMVDARELDAYRRGWRGVGQISQNF